MLERTACGLGELVEWDMGLFGITTKNKMKYSFEKPVVGGGRAVMKWHVTEGGVKELLGRYEFVSLGPSTTKVIYNLFVDPGFPLPEMIKKATNRTIAKAALQDLKKYTEMLRMRALKEEEERGQELGLTTSSADDYVSMEASDPEEKSDFFDVRYLLAVCR